MQKQQRPFKIGQAIWASHHKKGGRCQPPLTKYNT